MEPGFASPKLAGTIGVRGASEKTKSDAKLGEKKVRSVFCTLWVGPSEKDRFSN